MKVTVNGRCLLCVGSAAYRIWEEVDLPGPTKMLLYRLTLSIFSLLSKPPTGTLSGHVPMAIKLPFTVSSTSAQICIPHIRFRATKPILR